MRLTAKLDIRPFQAKLRAMVHERPRAATEVAKLIAHSVIRDVVTHAPRATNRYVRGWVQANNEASLEPMNLPTLMPNPKYDEFRRLLERQVEQNRRSAERLRGVLDAWFYSKGRRLTGYGRRLEGALRRVEHRLMRSEQELAKFIAADGQAVLVFVAGRDRILTTVREKVYGGRGRLVVDQGGAYVEAQNLEPHATIVEARTGVVAKAAAKFRAFGINRSKRVYIAGVTKGLELTEDEQ